MTSVNRPDRLISSTFVNTPDGGHSAPQVSEYYLCNGMYLTGIEGVALLPVTPEERSYLARYGTVGEGGRITFDPDHQPTSQGVVDLDAIETIVVNEPQYWAPLDPAAWSHSDLTGIDQDWGLDR